jgi:hypothetical protein
VANLSLNRPPVSNRHSRHGFGQDSSDFLLKVVGRRQSVKASEFAKLLHREGWAGIAPTRFQTREN